MPWAQLLEEALQRGFFTHSFTLTRRPKHGGTNFGTRGSHAGGRRAQIAGCGIASDRRHHKDRLGPALEISS